MCAVRKRLYALKILALTFSDKSGTRVLRPFDVDSVTMSAAAVILCATYCILQQALMQTTQKL